MHTSRYSCLVPQPHLKIFAWHVPTFSSWTSSFIILKHMEQRSLKKKIVLLWDLPSIRFGWCHWIIPRVACTAKTDSCVFRWQASVLRVILWLPVRLQASCCSLQESPLSIQSLVVENALRFFTGFHVRPSFILSWVDNSYLAMLKPPFAQ